MLNLRNKTAKQKGFTLVEVVVVVVIVAVLAAVGIGVYVQYANSARQAAARNLATSIAEFCGACRNGGGSVGGTAGSLSCTGGEGDGSSLSYDTQKHTLNALPSGTSGGTITVTDRDDASATASVNW
jgi:prepilin-type N-terminal cleavage/methylation domain-containing protein